MKKIMISLSLILFGWGFMINRLVVPAVILMSLCIVYLMINFKKVNRYRVAFISLLLFVCFYVLIHASNLVSLFNNFDLFILLNSLCLGLFNEKVLNNKNKDIFYFFILLTSILFISYLLVFIINDSYFVGIPKELVFIILSIVFLPYTFILGHNVYKLEVKTSLNLKGLISHN